MQSIVATCFAIIAGYLVAGFLFTILFLWKGCSSVDQSAKNAGLLLKILLAPGMTALWPIFLRKWIKLGK